MWSLPQVGPADQEHPEKGGSVSTAHEINVERANRAKQRAEDRISRGGEDIDYQRALVALERALVRIQVSRKARQPSYS